LVVSATIRDVLVAARALIEKSGAYDRRGCFQANGSPCSSLSSKAIRWSGYAAIARVAFVRGERGSAIHQRAVKAFGFELCKADRFTHADVLAAFDRAIAAQDGAS
jgi:hypothetical protein